MDIKKLLGVTLQQNASDLHLSAGEQPMLRIHGDLVKLDHPPMTAELVHQMVNSILNDAQQRLLEENKEIDFSYALREDGRFRVNAFYQNRGLAASFRAIPNVINSFEELGLPDICRQVAKYRKGLILVTGPTGSGKSTTLAAMVDYINRNRHEHIVTIEDPIEFIHVSHNCLINQRELGAHTHSFANALRSVLREDPDVILVGEMRDLETIALALTAAETGHLVFATLHTVGAPKTIDRVIDVFPAAQQQQIRTQFSETLQAVISQRLLRRKDGTGRVPCLEIMIRIPAISNLIRKNRVSEIPSIMQAGRKYGMQMMDAAILDLIRRDIIEAKDAEGLIDEKILDQNML
jgi:twitching motility protein PilT